MRTKHNTTNGFSLGRPTTGAVEETWVGGCGLGMGQGGDWRGVNVRWAEAERKKGKGGGGSVGVWERRRNAR